MAMQNIHHQQGDDGMWRDPHTKCPPAFPERGDTYTEHGVTSKQCQLNASKV
jgi:hypothetical protein